MDEWERNLGSILAPKILRSENFSEKYRKFGIQHFFQ
jgi:hypothetical protein